MPQWTTSGKKIYTTLLQVLDNHVIDYIPPSIYMQKDKDNRSKNGLLGMAIVGAISADPRLVNIFLLFINYFSFYLIYLYMLIFSIIVQYPIFGLV
jgi:hypothetical protein